ncbi:MAG TPA: hypothetical protein EYP34_01930 [Chromatiaceae bacterium]|nr:hypothetical protein [Chromatiaceae bacterium]
MAQLHCYVPDNLAKRFQEKARKSNLPVSKYLALLIEKEVENQWPAGYFDLFGSWRGERLERPDQGAFKQRADFD